MNAANDSGLSLEEMRTSLPEKLTMWIDPDEVSYRIGTPLLTCSKPFQILSFVCGREIYRELVALLQSFVYYLEAK
jgi:hypothetical protein